MISVAIKNAILLILIILIIHFMLKNALREKFENPLHPQPPPSYSSSGGEILPGAVQPSPPDALTSAGATASKKSDEEELLKYVLGQADSTTEPTTCKVQNTPYVPETTSLKAPKKTIPSSNGYSEFEVINEYEDETALNGGKVLGSLSGFDSNLDDFSSIDQGFAKC